MAKQTRATRGPSAPKRRSARRVDSGRRRGEGGHVEAKRLRDLQRRLGVTFRRPRMLEQALVHRSFRSNSDEECSNERLEFLGDAVLGQVVAEHFYRTFPEWTEGQLTKLKAAVVSEATLSEAARRIGLGDFLVMAKGEEHSGGRERPSLLSDALEAIIGAIYLDRGLRAARTLVLHLLEESIGALERDVQRRDYKTLLQELTQSAHKQPPAYRVVAEEGPDHDKTFVIEARFGRHRLGAGMGKSKKEAEQNAAKEALEDTERLERVIGPAAG
jgi:ribonuclease-3